VSVAALASSVLLLLTIGTMRAARLLRQGQLEGRAGAWHDALHLATEEPESAPMPRLRESDLPEFLVLWNHLQESLRGDAAANLAILLRRHGLDTRVMEMLHRRSTRLRLIAITALGHLREERAWADLEAIAREPGPVMSFAAARALLRIEPRRALEVLGPSIATREDWPLARLASLFQELGPAVVTPPLMGLMMMRPIARLERLVKLARFGHRERIAPVVRAWLSEGEDAGVIAAALDYVEDSADVPWARAAARHGDWKVRVAAARALGRVGDRGQLASLLQLLRDPVWWVRYHAAQALERLHGLSPTELEALRDGARDAYAADMLSQALAERGRA